MRATFGIGVGIFILTITMFFSFWGIDDFLIGLAIAIVTASLPYFWLIFPALTFDVLGDEAWIMVNPWMTESTHHEETFLGFRTIKAQREFHSGFHWRWPREYKVRSVELNRRILVVPEAGEVITTRDGKTYRVEWFVVVTPLPGYLVNFTKTNEEDVKKQVKGRVVQFLQGFFGDLESRSVKFDKRQLERIRIKFEKIFQGEEHLDDLEINLGIWTGTPKVVKVRQSSITEEARQLTQAIRDFSVAAKELVRSSAGSLKFREALGLIMMFQQNITAGGEQLSYVDATSFLLGMGGKKGQRS